MSGIKYSFHIAVEKYQDPSIKTVDYAEADAIGFAAVLQLHHFDKAHQQLLLSSYATKAATESKLIATTKHLTEDDTLFLSYAGHGFSKLGENFLTCHDTQPYDPVATSISLQELYKHFRASRCKRIALFLDSCESGILDMPSRSIFSQLSSTEIEEFFSNSNFCVCFASSETHQYSYSSQSLHHGIWSYHLIEALNGDVPQILESNRYLTAAALQDYLARTVPKTLAMSYSTPAHQTPRFYGTQSTGNFLIADLQELLEERAAMAAPGYQQVSRLVLTGSSEYQVRRLTGFAKHHRVPDVVNRTTSDFVASIGSKEVDDEINEVFELLRTKMGYTAATLSAGTDGGSGSIVTPDFDYNVKLTLDPDDPTTAILNRELSNIKTPQLIDSPQFGEVFATKFSTLELALTQTVRVDEWIHKIETLQRQGQLADMKISYPKDLSRCEMRFPGEYTALVLYPSALEISQHFVEPPAELFRIMLKMQTRLLAVPDFRLLPL